ncbi:MAG: response regulator [Verrucomicrobia bacterium]|nr:response regulator [Verrucomicrobiota bacterium]MBI3870387.1 response regulator [Verrucomicrobiota bacterium]
MKKVLVIDDTKEILEVISESLESFGYEAIVAADGPEGIRIAQEAPADLIICDVNMPGLDGYAVLLALRQIEKTATIPFIFLTSVADKIHVRRGMELGADDYLTKPFTQKELKAAVLARMDKQDELQRQTDRRLDELRGSLTLALPHELRTPLNGIMGLASILIEDYATCPPDEILSTASDIQACAERLHHLIENFLVFSQIQMLTMENKSLASGDHPALLSRDAMPAIAVSVARRHKRLSDLDTRFELALFEVPGESLRKIVEETLDNAFKFSAPGAPVRLLTRTTLSGAAEIVVEDRGRGMTAEQVSRIGPHVQFERSQYEQQGAGLGLMIAKRMTELLGGEYEIRSVPGQGTVVSIRFPQSIDSSSTCQILAREQAARGGNLAP